jgi:hypothetical protein
LYGPEIIVNGTTFPMRDVIRITTGPDVKSSGDLNVLVRSITSGNGFVDLTHANGDVVRIAPDGSFITIPATNSP